MRIFVGFGYNERDAWVKQLVFPIIEAFGHEISTGEEIFGEKIPETVLKRIAASDAVLGFLTRRDPPVAPDKWNSHVWVYQEIAAALANNLPIVEIREAGVDGQDGIALGRQRISYAQEKRDECLVELAKALGRWPRGRIRIRLEPNRSDIDELMGSIPNPDFGCFYRFMVDGDEMAERAAKLHASPGGLFIDVRNIPPESTIKVRLGRQQTFWDSLDEPTDIATILIRKRRS